MLFNSHEFLFAFLPATVFIYWLVAPLSAMAGTAVLLAASLFFYGWWDVRFLALLVGSILVNFTLGRLIAVRQRVGRERDARLFLALGVTIDLAVLALFKYANFFLTNVDAAAGLGLSLGHFVLPLGISFFTFEEIGFLVDVRQGRIAETNLLRFAFFVSFFPRLVAGPILRYGEIRPQLPEWGEQRRARLTDVAVGLSLLSIGLFKKSFLADGIAPFATDVFSSAAAGQPVDLLLSWGGTLAYALQIYFDFSGYSDMAIGAARCCGIRFPMNFFSPYQATSIIEFWRRWHITLSRFLRDYLYIPLGGNRRGRGRRYANLAVTMLLGGLWHGANWTFVAWGGLHGLYLIVNHAWLALRKKSTALDWFSQGPTGTACAFLLTFAAVLVAWVFFRAPNFTTAIAMLRGMAGANGIVIPNGIAFVFGPTAAWLKTHGVMFANESGTQLLETYLWIIPLLAIALLLPNAVTLLSGYGAVLDLDRVHVVPARDGASKLASIRWSLSPFWATAIGAIAFAGVISITRVSEFLYWQF